MKENKKATLQARVFMMSLKPAWTKEYIEEHLELMRGVAEMYVVNHDKDVSEDGEPIENHTHILLMYETPRKITTIANAFKVESNFIEVVRSKVAAMRYLTHKGTPNKYQYSADDVYTNSKPYQTFLEGQSISDAEIIEYVMQHREFELVGAVNMTKILMAQRLVNNKGQNYANQQLAQLREIIHKQTMMLERVSLSVDVIGNNFEMMVQGLSDSLGKLPNSVDRFALTIKSELALLRKAAK